MNPITEFLSTLNFDPDDRLSVNHQPIGGNFSSNVVSAKDVPAVVEALADHSCWIGANPISHMVTTGRGSASDVVALRNIYADLDLGKLPTWGAIDDVIYDLSEMLETPPAAIVMSGHGKQPRWIIEDGAFRGEEDRDRAAAASRRFGRLVQKVASRRGGAADSIHDLSRVLRAPGTMNTKNPDAPVLATVEYPGGFAITLDHVEAVLDAYGIPADEVVMAPTITTDPALQSEYHHYANNIAMPAAVRRVAEATENRNNTLNNQVLALAGIAAHDATLVDRNTVYAEMARACSTNGLLDDDGIAAFEATFDSAWRAGLTKPRHNWPPQIRNLQLLDPKAPLRSWDDFGNAQRLIDHNPDRLLWLPQAEKWAVFDGQKWEIDSTSAAQRLAQQTIEALPKTEAFQIPDPDTREAFLKWVKTQRSLRRVKDMIGTARGLPGLSAKLTDFDCDPMLLNCRNGVLNLDTLHLEPWSASNRQMQQAGAEYHPSAEAPRWEAFLEKMHPDPEVRAYLQRAIGYSLTGNISEQKLFMHLGEGANGKSVFLEVMTGLFGTYGQSIPRTTLLVKKYDGIPNDIARMVGKRFLQTSETGKGQVLDEETVKGLTGGEEQSARFMRQEFFDFKPTGKIHYVTNHFPRVSDAKSLWRRLVIIKWLTIIEDDDPTRDHSLAAKILANELDGVLAWAVRGMVEWRLVGLSEPQTVRQWTREYKDEADDFGDFLAECTLVNSQSAFVPTQRLHEAYVAWMDRGKRGLPMSVKSFSTAMKERGFTPVHRNRHRGFSGLDVIPVWQGMPGNVASPSAP